MLEIDQKVRTLLAHPKFIQVIIRDVEQSAETAPGRVAKHTANLDNFLLEREIMHLDLRLRLEGAGRGATLSELQAFAARHRVCSARRVNLLISELIAWKRVQQVQSAEDGRVRQLIPCAPLLDYQVQCQIRSALNIKVLNPESTLADMLMTDKDVLDQYLLTVGELFHEGMAAPLQEQRLFKLISHDAGIAILYSMLNCVLVEHGIVRAGLDFRVAQSKIAEDYGISRTHIRNFTEKGLELGLLTVSTKDKSKLCVSELLMTNWSSLVAFLMVRADQAVRILNLPKLVALGEAVEARPPAASTHVVH